MDPALATPEESPPRMELFNERRRSQGRPLHTGRLAAGVSEIFRVKTRVFGNPCQHARTDFVVIVKGENEVWESGTPKNSMGAASALDAPAGPKQSRKYSSSLG